MTMTVREVEQAAQRLRDVVHSIPISSSRTFSNMSGAELFLKCENLQKTGSFKVRGAYNKIAMLKEAGNLHGVVASSAGNHAQGVAYAATALGVPSTIVMPRSAPLAKVSATEGYGAKVILHGNCYDEAYQHALALQKEEGSIFVHPFNDLDVMAGQGTVALEIFHDVPQVDTVLVPVGGGGLLAGMASYIKQINPRVRVVGVQAEGADAVVRSYRLGSHLSTLCASTIADGICVKTPGDLTMQHIHKYVDEMVTVTDEEIAEAILLLLERTKMVVEPAGAAALAAAINRKIDLEGHRVVCVLSGGNIDVSFIQKIVEKGLVTRGRLLKFRTAMPDVPGNLYRIAGILADGGANVILVEHDRVNSDLRINEAYLHIACEISGPAHARELIAALEEKGYRVTLEL